MKEIFDKYQKNNMVSLDYGVFVYIFRGLKLVRHTG